MSNINLDVSGTKVSLEPITAQTFSLTVPSAVPAVITALATGPQGPAAPALYGSIARVTSGTVAGVSPAGTYRTTGLTGTLGPSEGFVRGTDDEMGLKNDSGKTLLMKFYGSADVQSGNNHVVGLKLALNGVAIDASECRSGTGQGSVNFAKTVTTWLVEVEDGDEVSLFIADFTGTADQTVQRCRLVATFVEEV